MDKTLSLQQMTDIMTAANLAIAKGFTVKAGDTVIDGIVINGDTNKLQGIQRRYSQEYRQPDTATYVNIDRQRIVVIKQAEIEIDELYDPLSNSSP
jgi:hypothetical protein